MSKSDELGKTFRRGVVAGLLSPFLVAFGGFWGSFPIMIGLGVWHHEIDSRVPALGFWPVLGISWGLSAVVTKFRVKYNFGKVDKLSE